MVMGATLLSNQIVCSKCEELVHRYAARCPYCSEDLTKVVDKTQIDLPKEPTSCKITQLEQPRYASHHPEELLQKAVKQEARHEEEEGNAPSIFKVLMPLISLLAGSFFIFFSVMLKLFSKNGKLVLEWNMDSWPYYLVPALFLLVIGMTTLGSSEE